MSEYFETLYRSAPFGYLVTDEHDIVVRVNETLLGWCGFDEQRMLGRPFRSFLAPGSQLLYETRHLPVLRLQGFAHEVFLQIATAEGSLLPVLINATAVPGEEGAPGEVRIGALDATSRVSYERELLSTQRSAESLAARVAVLQNASATFERSATELEIAGALGDILEGALVATAASVAITTTAGELEVVAGDNRLAGLVRVDPDLLGDTVLQGEKAVVVSVSERDPTRYPAVVSALHEARLQTVAVFPIMSDATPLGVIAVFFGRERSLDATESEMVASVARQASQVITRMRAQLQLAYAALHDPLTGLANRALIRESISLGLASAIDTGGPLAVMFIDLDGFKAVNDRLGHHTGDSILREVGVRLLASVRGSDIVGRYGGDEFVVICSDTDADSSAAIAARIHDAVRAAFAASDNFSISASIGVANHRTSATTSSVDGIIGAADAAMYESKRLGRDRTTQVAV